MSYYHMYKKSDFTKPAYKTAEIITKYEKKR